MLSEKTPNSKLYLTVICISVLLTPQYDVVCSDTTWYIGASAHAGIAFQFPSFTNLPTIPAPSEREQFTGGDGLAWSLAAEAGIPASHSVNIGLRIDYTQKQSLLKADEPIVYFDRVSDQLVESAIVHELDATLADIGIEPSLTYTGVAPLTMSIGLRTAFAVSSTFRQIQVPPSGVTLISGDFEFEGEVPDAVGIRFAATGAIGWDIPLSNRVRLRPQARYEFGLNDIIADSGWGVAGLSAGVAVLWRPGSTQPLIIRDTLYKRDTTIKLVAGIERDTVVFMRSETDNEIEEQPPVVRIVTTISEAYQRMAPKSASLLTAALELRFVMDNKESEALEIKMSAMEAVRHIPLLPYVFFDDRQTTLPQRYRGEPSAVRAIPSCSDSSIALFVYRRIIGIIGQRLQRNPQARVTLRAMIDGGADERQKAERRIAAIRGIWRSQWNVGETQVEWEIEVDTTLGAGRRMPALYGDVAVIELFADPPQLLEPIPVCDTALTTQSPIIRFKPLCIAEAGLKEWIISVQQNGQIIKSFSGEDKIPAAIDWKATRTEEFMLSAGQPLECSMLVVDRDGQKLQTDAGVIRFDKSGLREESGADREKIRLDRFSLFSSRTVAEQSVQLSNEVIASKIHSRLQSPNSVYIVSEAEHFTKSAMEARLLLGESFAKRAVVVTPNRQEKTFPENLPEGRYYNRRIHIAIENIIE